MEPSQHRVYVVDDDDSVATLLQQLLIAEGYEAVRARDGCEALELLAERPADLVFLDLDMPRLNGFEVCRHIKSDPATRLTPVVIVTGHSEFDARLKAWELGADDFLTKPFQPLEVVARCRALLRVKDLTDQLDSAQTVLFSLARALEAKSCYTQGHSERVTASSLALADRAGLSEADEQILRRGAALHDIGKIAVPDAILNKPGPLTPEEFEVVKRHPLEGVRIVEPLRSLQDAIPLIRWHHERMDGSGYPDGLYGGSIPLVVRVLAVADVYDALASVRPYRPPLSPADCLKELANSAARGGLDPELVRLFCEPPAIPLAGVLHQRHAGTVQATST